MIWPERETDMADETNGITYFCVYPSNRSWISNESETEPETGTETGTGMETPLLPSWGWLGPGRRCRRRLLIATN